MRVYHDFIFGTRIQINVSWYGSGSGQMIRIRPDPDPKHWFFSVWFYINVAFSICGKAVFLYLLTRT